MNWRGALLTTPHPVSSAAFSAGAGKTETVTIKNLIVVEPKGLVTGTPSEKYEESLQTLRDTVYTAVALDLYIMTTHGVILDL